MIERTYFDESLPKFAELVAGILGMEALEKNLFLRDASGYLTFIVLDTNVSIAQREALTTLSVDRLWPYVERNGFAVATPAELFDDRLNDFHNARRVNVWISSIERSVWIVDRRMVGADWLREPLQPQAGPLRVVFSSLKGGVGRTTALCVAAAHLASRGLRVLAVDMDLEAPGLGSMLLSDATLPTFGLLDYLVEEGVEPVHPEFFVDMVAPSWLTHGRGRVDVVPAIGRRSIENPANVLGKIARAYLASSPAGALATFTDHMRTVVAAFSQPHQYDVILIDARAGLHETTAAAVVGLGAEVLLFGLDQPQTFSGYRLLFSHLGTLSSSAEDDWRERLHFVHAKASESASERRRFSSDIGSLQLEYLWKTGLETTKRADLSALKESFEVEWADTGDWDQVGVGPSETLSILDDARYANFDPVGDSALLDSKVYAATYSEFLSALEALLESDQ